MAKSAGGVRGGRYSQQIADARSLYERERRSAYRDLEKNLIEIERRGLTDREYNILSRNVAYFDNNPTYGTIKNLNDYIADNIRKIRSGEYDERLMNLSSGLGGEVVRTMSQSAASRDLLERYRKLLRQYNRR